MESKQRLRPWLEAQINNGEIPGLQWVNPEKTKFQIPWKHGGKQDWNPDSGRIFKEWARHTGRFREGIDEPDYVKWKTRLRCAFNKAPDIEEVKEESQLEGPDPYRVYILKPRQNGKKASEPENKVYTHQPPRFQYGLPNAAPIPAFLEDMNNASTASIDGVPKDLRDIKSGDMMKLEDMQMSFSNVSLDDVVMLSDNLQSLMLQKEEPAAVADPPRMILKIFYCRKEVMDGIITAPYGCRIYYDTYTPTPEIDLPSWIAPLTYQREDGEFLCLPPCKGLMDTMKLESLWQSVLIKGLRNGICIQTHEDDIYALRFCTCQIFHASECGTGGNPVPLQRQRSDDDSIALTKIFDYKNAFLPALKRYLQGLGPKPSPTVYLIFGTNIPVSKLNTSQGIYISVTSTRALETLQEYSTEQVISSDEKCASMILKYEALNKELPGGFGDNLEWNEYSQGAEAAVPEDLIMTLEDMLQQSTAGPEFYPEISNDEISTLDFSDLTALGFDFSDPGVPAFLKI